MARSPQVLLDEDLYSGYNEYPQEFSTKNLDADVIFQQAIGSSYGRKPLLTGKSGTGFRLDTSYGYRDGTGFRPTTGAQSGAIRPMTAVRGAGYTSQRSSSVFDPMNQGRGSSPQLQSKKEETPEIKIKKLEKKIMELIEESCIASSKGESRLALEYAKESSTKERSLIRMEEQASLSESHNLDLTFSVLFNLANQYAANEMYTEALNTYQVITKNRMFINSNRLKINMGNIYFKLGQFTKAIKMYRMALDQVPNSQKDLRIKIMHNIGILFVKMGQFRDACSSFEYIMQEKPDFKSGLHAILCYYALGYKEKMKKGLQSLLEVPLHINDEETYVTLSDDPSINVLMDVIKYDSLHNLERQMKQHTEKCILTAARIIAPVIEDSFMSGYNWCLETIKSSAYALLANELEINKAIMFLKQKDIAQAINVLQFFEKKDTKMASVVATNLSFVHFLRGEIEESEKYGKTAREIDAYNSDAFVNLGDCSVVKGDLDSAKDLYMCALESDATCIEALYNLGLSYKWLGLLDDSMDCFLKLQLIMRHHPEILYQLASLCEQMEDIEQATEWYLQLLGIVPTDPYILQKIGEMFDRQGDKQQAYQYMYDSFRFFPSNLKVLDWLGTHFLEKQSPSKAFIYYRLAALVQPDVVKWQLMLASCLHQRGHEADALNAFKKIHEDFPENTECVKFLVNICTLQGLDEDAALYAKKLKKIESRKEIRQRISTSRPSSFRSGSGRSSRSSISDAGSPVSDVRGSPVSHSATKFSLKNSNMTLIESNESFMEDPLIYSDPLGPLAERPRTSGSQTLNLRDEFEDEKLGDDLLPD